MGRKRAPLEETEIPRWLGLLIPILLANEGCEIPLFLECCLKQYGKTKQNQKPNRTPKQKMGIHIYQWWGSKLIHSLWK